MARRLPSLPVTDRIADGLRRRSGGPAISYATLHGNDDSIDVLEDEGHSCTVLLVSQSKSFLVNSHLFEDRPVQQKEPHDALFIPVPLTPRPGPPSSRNPTEASLQSTHTQASEIPRLPTPDFDNPSEACQTRTNSRSSRGPISFLLRGFTFVSLHVPTSSFLSRPSTPASSRPQSVRSDSGESSYSTWSASTTDSVDSGHKTLIHSIGTTAKFTHRWPKPLPMRGLEIHGGNSVRGSRISDIAAAAAMLEEGQGLGMSPVQRWTTFKCFLLFSVCTVFACGIAGLACAILSWFRSKVHLLKISDET